MPSCARFLFVLFIVCSFCFFSFLFCRFVFVLFVFFFFSLTTWPKQRRHDPAHLEWDGLPLFLCELTPKAVVIRVVMLDIKIIIQNFFSLFEKKKKTKARFFFFFFFFHLRSFGPSGPSCGWKQTSSRCSLCAVSTLREVSVMYRHWPSLAG